MCPVCPSETIDQSQVELAEQMRTIVREKLADGESRGQILRFFVDRYGEEVLAAPPRRGFNLLVWLVPPGGLAAGGGLLFTIMRTMRRRPTLEVDVRIPAEGLDPYLQRVDEELASYLDATRSADHRGKPPHRSQSSAEEQARS